MADLALRSSSSDGPKRYGSTRVYLFTPIDGDFNLRERSFGELKKTETPSKSRRVGMYESSHEFESRFGLAIFVYAKNTQNSREYRVVRTNAYLNEAAIGHCSPVTVDRMQQVKRRQRAISPSPHDKCALGIIT